MARKKSPSRKSRIVKPKKASRKPLRAAKKIARSYKPKRASRKQLQDAKKQLKHYRKLAKDLSKVVPDFRKLIKKKRLTVTDKQRLTKRAKSLKGVKNLFVLTKKETKTFKEFLFPGTGAIRLRNTSDNATVRTNGKDLIVTSNGRTWIYWKLNKATVRNKTGKLEAAAQKAYTAQFPIEVVAELADKAFKELNVEAVTIWTNAGRSNETFSDFRQFMLWVSQHWQAGKYIRHDPISGIVHDETDPGKWINGLAILVSEPVKPKRKSKHKATINKYERGEMG